ncbi:uncharacterized protein LOC104907033 [Beta vulgaris subsp. vulgaris]|uniref:uncharacterized protein LOC104907033 n=1 Tax=Beta vulgaris subsp. vulgaris TaxID=3555 RepID=UPI0020375B1A|nr:uncharacterized protein LOC104907033 [Beta vulgaris subsp. vulgaris]
MAKLSNNLFVMTILFAFVAITVSAYESYAEQPAYEQPTYEQPAYEQPAYIYPPATEPQPPQTNPTCRNITELCTSYGDYSCCDGFTCTGWKEKLPGGAGVCTPLGEEPRPPKEKCQKTHQLCQPYGPYICCPGELCVHPRKLPPAAGLDPEQAKLPPGVGVCEPIKL